MSPFQTAVISYQKEPQNVPFEDYLEWHFRNGFVFSTPDMFVMGRAIHITEGNEELTQSDIDGFKRWPSEEQNAWYVHMFSGDLSQLFKYMPYPLPMLAFERVRSGKRELQIVSLNRIAVLSQYKN